MADSTVQIEDFVRCVVCQDTLNEPRNLPCGHTFCKNCIVKWHCERRNTQSGTTFTNCPTCRKPFKLGKDGMEGLPINYHLSDLVEVLKTKSDCSTSQSCEMCQSVPPNRAVYACIDCQLKMCQDCKHSHDKFRGASAHSVTEMSETSEKLITMRRKKSYCRQHTHENHELEYYCKDCNKPICTICSLVNHKHHCREELWMYARESRTFIEQISQETEKKREQYFRLLEDINYERDSVKHDEDETIETIRFLTAELIDAIKQKEASQVANITSSTKSKMDQLRKKQEECETEIALIDSFNLFAHSLCKFGSDANVVLQGKYVETQSKKISNNAVNFRFEQNRTRYVISDRLSVLLREIKNEDFVVCKQNECCRESALQTTTSVDSDGQQNDYMDAISRTDAINNQIVFNNEERQNADSSIVLYEHVENTSLESKQIPCTTAPPRPPKHFKHNKMVKVSDDLSIHNLLFSKSQEDLVKDTTLEELNRPYGHHKDANEPRNNDSNHFSPPKRNAPPLPKPKKEKENTLGRMNKLCEYPRLTEEKHEHEILPTTLIREFNVDAKTNITGLTITEHDEVVVISNVPGSILIYSQDGKQICKLRCNGFENPYDAAAGRHGYVYITDTGTREYGIKVLQKKGKKYELSTFLREPDNPHGISFHFNNLYVCDATALSVSVYRSDNKMRIRTIEAKVQGPIFSCPIYITALESDVVLISDYKDKNVYRIKTGRDISTVIVFNKDVALSKSFRPAKTSASADDKYFITDMASGEIFVIDNRSGKTFRLNFTRHCVTPTALHSQTPESLWIGTKEGKMFHVLLEERKTLNM